jgi:hypothetical protein
MTFKVAATITSVIAFLLGAGYLLIGEVIIGRWQIQISDAILLMGRRMGALYLGLSVMFFVARSVPVSTARRALTAGAASALSLLALLGIYELAVGHVGTGILASIVIEALLAIAYIRIVLVDRKQTVGA